MPFTPRAHQTRRRWVAALIVIQLLLVGLFVLVVLPWTWPGWVRVGLAMGAQVFATFVVIPAAHWWTER